MAESSSKGRLEARFTLSLNLPREQAWQRLVSEIDAWWPVAYRVAGESSRISLQAVPGGQLLEDAGQGNGVLWYTVQAVDAPSSMVLAGTIAPPWGGPALTLLRLALSDGADGGCQLEVHDSMLGHVDPAAVEAGWRDIFGSLQRHLA